MSNPVRTAVVASAAIVLLAGCAGGTSLVAPTNSAPMSSRAATRLAHPTVGGWMKPLSSTSGLVYLSDSNHNDVTVYDTTGTLQGQITGLGNPMGLLVDGGGNLWVTNPGSSQILEFARGGTTPIKILNDTIGSPVDVTICRGGTVFVSDRYNYSGMEDLNSKPDGIEYPGGVAVFAAGATTPTRNLSFPVENNNYYVACDAEGNIFTTIFQQTGGAVIEYPHGHRPGIQLPIKLTAPSGIRVTNAGNLLVADPKLHTITGYTEAGIPTGTVSKTSPIGFVEQLALSTDSHTIGYSDIFLKHGISRAFPGYTERVVYRDPLNGNKFRRDLIGFAFDPAQRWIGQ